MNDLSYISDGAKIHQRCDVRSNFTIFFDFTAIRFRLTDAMHLIQRALESPDLEDNFQYQIQCEKIKKKFLETF